MSLTAATNTGVRGPRQTGDRGFCTVPRCGQEMCAVCGDEKIWHWRHLPGTSGICPGHHEPESQWHLAWKMDFPERMREVAIGDHVADVFNGTTVIEFQHSNIQLSIIAERELEYGDMVWMLDGIKFRDRLSFTCKDGILKVHGIPSVWMREPMFEMRTITDPRSGRSLSYFDRVNEDRGCGPAVFIDMAFCVLEVLRFESHFNIWALCSVMSRSDFIKMMGGEVDETEG